MSDMVVPTDRERKKRENGRETDRETRAKHRNHLETLTSARPRGIQEAVSAARRRAHAVPPLSRLRLQAFLRLEAAQTVGGQRPHAGATGGVTVWKRRDGKQVREGAKSHDRRSV